MSDDVEPEPDENGKPKPPPVVASLISPQLVAGLVVAILALLSAVVVVGLAQRTLDTTGVATVLSTLISGVVVGALLKGKDGGTKS